MNGERKLIMAKYRKLGRTSSQRKALLRNQVTALLNNGKIVTEGTLEFLRLNNPDMSLEEIFVKLTSGRR